MCKESKTLDKFHIHKGGKYGVGTRCKVCSVIQHKLMSLKYPARFRKLYKRSYKSNKEKLTEDKKVWSSKNRFKINTHSKVKYEIKMGRMKRPKVCSNKGKYCTPTIEGHHDDYSKPFDVRWLCHRCHMEHHSQIKMRAKKIINNRNKAR